MELRGIDVSHNNRGTIDWRRVANDGIRFTMIRAGYGSTSGRLYIDRKFAENVKGAAAVGVDIGIYVFSYALTVDAARLEAQNLVSLLATSRDMITYPVAYDIEHKTQAYEGRRATNTAQAIAFLSVVKSAGYTPILYVNPGWMASYIDYDAIQAATGAELWLADWRKGMKPDSRAGIWQYEVRGTAADVKANRATVIGKVDGVAGAIDVNVSYKDYAAKTAGEDEFGMIYKTVGDVPAGEMRETIRKLVQADVLRGGADGCINVPHEVARVYVVNRRAGAYEGIGIPKKWDNEKQYFIYE